jgi:hypothetical protein
MFDFGRLEALDDFWGLLLTETSPLGVILILGSDGDIKSCSLVPLLMSSSSSREFST